MRIWLDIWCLSARQADALFPELGLNAVKPALCANFDINATEKFRPGYATLPTSVTFVDVENVS